MYKLYLQNIVNDISFENLPIKWQGLDLWRFSKDKTLFPFQKDALINALKGLWLYFKDRNADKKAFFEHYKLNGLEENFDYDLRRREDNKTAKYLLEYEEHYPPTDDKKISFAHFITLSFFKSKLFQFRRLFV